MKDTVFDIDKNYASAGTFYYRMLQGDTRDYFKMYSSLSLHTKLFSRFIAEKNTLVNNANDLPVTNYDYIFEAYPEDGKNVKFDPSNNCGIEYISIHNITSKKGEVYVVGIDFTQQDDTIVFNSKVVTSDNFPDKYFRINGEYSQKVSSVNVLLSTENVLVGEGVPYVGSFVQGGDQRIGTYRSFCNALCRGVFSKEAKDEIMFNKSYASYLSDSYILPGVSTVVYITKENKVYNVPYFHNPLPVSAELKQGEVIGSPVVVEHENGQDGWWWNLLSATEQTSWQTNGIVPLTLDNYIQDNITGKSDIDNTFETLRYRTLLITIYADRFSGDRVNAVARVFNSIKQHQLIGYIYVVRVITGSEVFDIYDYLDDIAEYGVGYTVKLPCFEINENGQAVTVPTKYYYLGAYRVGRTFSYILTEDLSNPYLSNLPDKVQDIYDYIPITTSNTQTESCLALIWDSMIGTPTVAIMTKDQFVTMTGNMSGYNPNPFLNPETNTTFLSLPLRVISLDARPGEIKTFFSLENSNNSFTLYHR